MNVTEGSISFSKQSLLGIGATSRTRVKNKVMNWWLIISTLEQKGYLDEER